MKKTLREKKIKTGNLRRQAGCGKNFYFAYRSFWPEPEAHRRFNGIGVKTVCFFAANTFNSLGEPYCKYPPSWVFRDFSAEGQYDFQPVDDQMRDLTNNSPGADFICMVDLNTPLWLGSYIFKCDSFSQLGRLCSDPEWRRVTAMYMENFLLHMERTWPGKISAYVLSGGSTSEWYDFSGLAESPSRLAAWNSLRAREGLPPSEIPGLMAREHISFDNLLRDPQADGEALHYIRFCQEQVTGTIKFFAEKAREVIPAKTELGVFFGYPLTLQGWRVIAGNNDCGPLLKSPDIDFIISPIEGKTFAPVGKGGGDLGPLESVELAGKRYLRECDHKTHTYNKKVSRYATVDFDIWKSEAETIAGIKRELGYSLVKRTSLWWFDMWGGFYDSPAVMDLLKQCRQLYRRHIEKPVEKIAEIALIVDPDSIYYLNQTDDRRVCWFYRAIKSALDMAGAPYECYNFEDIPRIHNRRRIKLWLLPGIFEVTPEKRQILDRFVRCRQQTVLYLYAPGISDGRSLDPLRVRELAGCDFGKQGVNISDMGGHRAVYIASGDDVTEEVMKDIVLKAGVHIYCCRTQPVYANSMFITVHTAEGGRQKVHLPRKSGLVRELFSGRVVARDCMEFEYDFLSPDTGLFMW